MAGALLAELVLFGNVKVAHGAVLVVDEYPPTDSLAHRVLDLLVSQSQHRDVATWLEFLGTSAVADVGQRLQRHGLAREVTYRRLLATRKVWLPTDSEEALAPGLRLAYRLSRPPPADGAVVLSFPDSMLACLVDLLGLAGHVFWNPDWRPAARAHLDRTRGALPTDLAELYDAVDRAVHGRVGVSH
ncbi:hypothetical protein Val02_66800 [Virgisporangium aliadipatigenens]|uniref:GPP34 family phosphoprotein n=1 Tax=Virgisporangium aliadipatigenens TaxID=741659 RepID=A0A8J4DTI3_9ACTN|nr:hypothetical protein Val02_66800 [Virgisporangium aliadipatigenens]